MTTLVACLGQGKGTWTEVAKLISAESWSSVYLVTNQFGIENFKGGSAQFIAINDLARPEEIAEAIRKQLAGKIQDTEVALNFSSGNGNEHMGMLSAMLKLGLGIRLVVPSESGAKEL